MDSGLSPLEWELRILVESLTIYENANFFKEFLSMVFFMVFIVRRKAYNLDTMKGKLMLAWYQST